MIEASHDFNPGGEEGPHDLSEIYDIDEISRALAARKDSAMLGESGYERIDADFYPTPPEYVDCLLQYTNLLGDLIWEPACGNGAISKRLMERGHETWSSDLNDQGFGTPNRDFLLTTELPNPNVRSIITNPPYETIELKEEGEWEHLISLAESFGIRNRISLAELFVRHAIELMRPVRGQVAMFLRNEFDCGKKRMNLFTNPPFHQKIVTTQRPRWIAESTGSPRHSYSWFVWDWRHIKGPASVHYSHPSTARRK